MNPSSLPRFRRIAGITLAMLYLLPRLALAFTQSGVSFDMLGSGIPMGHEWVTRLAALELLGGDPIMKPDPRDPRRFWTQGLAKNLDLSGPLVQREVERLKSQDHADSRYQSTYKAVYDAIVGERWVDIGGFNVTQSQVGKYDCHDAVTQEPAEVQYDHFMRRYDDRDGQGGVDAAMRSRERFIQYFVDAALAPPTLMKVWDGGGYSAVTEVDRNYFLFGRAAHLFEDSFSSEHTVRIKDDNYERVRQVKSYLCAAGSEQHQHSNIAVFNYSSGDVIWNPDIELTFGWSSYKPSHMKDVALVATEATKDLWAAFIRTMALPLSQREAAARTEASQLVKNWLDLDPEQVRTWYDNPVNRDNTYVRGDGQTGKAQSVEECMVSLGVPSGNQEQKVAELENLQRMCLYNVKVVPGYADLFDPSLHMPFHWEWLSKKWETPPSDWRIPERPADTGVRVRIKSALNDQYMSAPDGIAQNKYIYCRKDAEPKLEFIRVGDEDNAFYRLTNASLFLSYTASTGAVKLFNTPQEANYQLQLQSEGTYGIRSLRWNQWMWLSKESPYINRTGDPKTAKGQWKFEGVTPPGPGAGAP